MLIKINRDKSGLKPINYKRKNKCCTCVTRIVKSNDTRVMDLITVKYSVTPNDGNIKSSNIKKKLRHNIYSYWGVFDQVLEIPEIFNKMNEDDYYVHVSNFLRDNILMPFIDYIQINNIEKYENLKNKENRKQKLFKIKTL